MTAQEQLLSHRLDDPHLVAPMIEGAGFGEHCPIDAEGCSPLARELDRTHPIAAASLREGMAGTARSARRQPWYWTAASTSPAA